MAILRKGSYANVTATAALVIALGGTSYAAVVITGSDIKNGTVASADVENGASSSRTSPPRLGRA